MAWDFKLFGCSYFLLQSLLVFLIHDRHKSIASTTTPYYYKSHILMGGFEIFQKKNPVLDAVQKMIGTVPQKVTGGGLESFQGVSVIINLIGINILVNSFNYQASQYSGREITLFWISELKADYGQAWLAYCIVYWLFTNIF